MATMEAAMVYLKQEDTAEDSEVGEHPWPHIESMFSLYKTQQSSYLMRCLLCAPKQTNISAYKNSTSNLRKHVARIHPNSMKKYTDLINSQRKRKSLPTDQTPAKVPKLSDCSSSQQVTQATLDNLLIRFVCEANLPLSVVETPSFKTMMGVVLPKHTVMTRKTLRSKIQGAARTMKKLIIKKLSTVSHVATTTDCWSARQRSYVGVTCHWIDDTTLERHSAALACRPLKGSHTFDVLVAALEEIHSEYQICRKVTRTTTDSGSNLLRAFRMFGKDEEATNEQEDLDSISNDDESENETESEIEIQDVAVVLNSNTGFEYHLPRHQKCACHLLNLICTVDATATAVTNDAYKRLSQSAFTKCNALWNKTSRSTVAFEIVERECKLQFLRPCQTRWSSLFLAVKRVVRIHKEQGEAAIQNVCTALNLKMFNSAELGFLSEYTAVMKPVAMALNILQGKTSVHMGFLLPTLHQLQEKLMRLELSCKICKPLVVALLNGIQRRFGDAMDDPELIAAAILLPKFRTYWTTKEHVLKAGLDFIKNNLQADSDEEEDFFAPIRSEKPHAGELERYLSCTSSEGMDLLHNYPCIKKLSVKLNTALPASAACERLFTTKQSQLHSKNFESQLLLKLNHQFTEGH